MAFATSATPAAAVAAEGDAAGAPWWFVTLALLIVGAMGIALGLSAARLRGGRELRAARAEVQRLTGLQRHWGWETDREHRLRTWRAPALGRRTDERSDEREAALAQGGRTLFSTGSASAEGLRSHLRSEQPFHGLHARAGETEWVFDGAPRFDDDGRFAGFQGQARALGAEDELGVGAQTLRQVLGAFPGPALLAVQQPDRWVVRSLNTAGQSHWPQLALGADLALAWDGLPESLPSAVDLLVGGGSMEAGGWRMTRFRIDSGRNVLVVARSGAGSDAAEEFGSTLSHDLRAPLRVVEGFTRIVKEDYGPQLDRVGNDHLERVLGAAARMNLMIEALLTMSRLAAHPLARQPVDLSQLAAFVVEDLRRTQPERQVEVEIEPKLSAEGDPTLLRMVLENLLGNAWKYTARTTAARISLRRVHAAGRTAYAVADNGAGFDMRGAERLFGLFQRLHSASEFAGSGVGLASVKRIVQRHGGQIWASAAPGEGAVFTFTLS